MEARCDICGQLFANKFTLGPHKRVCSRKRVRIIDNSDFTQSDSSAPSSPNVVADATVYEPVQENTNKTQNIPHEQEALFNLATRVTGASSGISTTVASQRSVVEYNPAYTHDYVPVRGPRTHVVSSNIWISLCTIFVLWAPYLDFIPYHICITSTVFGFHYVPYLYCEHRIWISCKHRIWISSGPYWDLYSVPYLD